MNTILCSRSRKITEFNSHIHKNEWEISLQLKGESEAIINGICYPMNEGDIRVVPPGVPHEGYSRESYFTDIFMNAKKLNFSDITIVHDYDKNVLQLFNMLDKVMTEKEANYAALADAITDTICQYIKKYSEIDFKYDFVIKFKNMIYENISNADFSISDEIHRLGFNTDYFRRCFKEELDKTPLEYLTALRIELAQKLLRQESFQSVENVAFQCGYHDSFYFSKIFKRHTGLTPRDFRKKNLT